MPLTKFGRWSLLIAGVVGVEFAAGGAVYFVWNKCNSQGKVTEVTEVVQSILFSGVPFLQTIGSGCITNIQLFSVVSIIPMHTYTVTASDTTSVRD